MNNRIGNNVYINQDRILNPYKPKRYQVALLELYMSPDCSIKMADLAKELGISRNSVNAWFKCNDFVDWFYTSVARAMRDKLPGVWAAIYRTALVGNVSAQKLFLERFDPEYIPQLKAELITKEQHEVNINLNEDRIAELIGKYSNEYKGMPANTVNSNVPIALSGPRNQNGESNRGHNTADKNPTLEEPAREVPAHTSSG